MKPVFDKEGIKIFLADCLPELEKMEDNQFDLAICDVPYGIKEDGRNNHTRSRLAVSKDYRNKSRYDNKSPDKIYFDHLLKISKNQIIWGANHFISKMPYDSSCWIIWDKKTGNNDFADCELTWTSFSTAVRKFEFQWQGMIQGYGGNKSLNENRIHPNQKPVALYKWLLQKYAKPGWSIFDSHAGSCSLAIACLELGFTLTAFEIDKDYCEAAIDRIERYLKQPKLFKPIMKELEQERLF
jgi:site-specific DNA-methyltransferase (adenine-specific)